MGSDTRRTSISLPQDLLEKGQRIAKERRRNFSNYIADLIASDCERPLATLAGNGRKGAGRDGTKQA